MFYGMYFSAPTCGLGAYLCVRGPHLPLVLEVRVGGLGPGEFQEMMGEFGFFDPEVHVPHETGGLTFRGRPEAPYTQSTQSA